MALTSRPPPAASRRRSSLLFRANHHDGFYGQLLKPFFAILRLLVDIRSGMAYFGHVLSRSRFIATALLMAKNLLIFFFFFFFFFL